MHRISRRAGVSPDGRINFLVLCQRTNGVGNLIEIVVRHVGINVLDHVLLCLKMSSRIHGITFIDILILKSSIGGAPLFDWERHGVRSGRQSLSCVPSRIEAMFL